MTELRVTKIGDEAGVALPETVLARLGVAEGDVLFLTETARGIELTPNDPALERQLRIAEDVMREDYDVLRRLAG